MCPVVDLLELKSGREAGLVGGVSALLAGTLVTVGGSDIGTEGLSVGALTALLFFVVLVALNVYRR